MGTVYSSGKEANWFAPQVSLHGEKPPLSGQPSAGLDTAGPTECRALLTAKGAEAGICDIAAKAYACKQG
jgi:hypothetical protein